MTVKLVLHRGWEYAAFRSTETRDALAWHAGKLAGAAIKAAPRRSARDHWNSTKRNITAHIDVDAWGWYANVTIEDDPRVRHTMLQERGWTDRAGGRHAGRHFLKEALARARVE